MQIRKLVLLTTLIVTGCVTEASERPEDIRLGTVQSGLQTPSANPFMLMAPASGPDNSLSVGVTWTGATSWLSPLNTGAPGLGWSNQNLEAGGIAGTSSDKHSHVDVFWLNTNHQISLLSWSGTQWVQGGWGSPNNVYLFGAPGVASGKAGRLEVFSLGYSLFSNTYSIYRRNIDNGILSSWMFVAAVPSTAITSEATFGVGVAAVSWGLGHTDLFVKNIDTYLHYATSNGGTSWTSDVWSPGGNIFGLANVASQGSQQLDLFTRRWTGTAFDIIHMSYSLGTLSTENLGNPCPAGQLVDRLQGADALPSIGLDAGPYVRVDAACMQSGVGNTSVVLRKKWSKFYQLPGAWSTPTDEPSQEPAGYWKYGGTLVLTAYP